MLVLRRTVGTSISILARDVAINVELSELDFLGGCVVVEIKRDNGDEPVTEVMGAGELRRIHADVTLQLLRMSYASHEGTPACVAEFGITAPRSIPITRAELDI